MPTPPEPDLLSQRTWLDHLFAHLPVAAEGSDLEGVHQVRVAAGRLDTWLRLGERPALRDGLRRFRRSAGRLRDLDVLLASDPPPAWEPWLRERWRREHARFRAGLEDPGLEELLAALERLPGIEHGLARRNARKLEEQVAARGRRLEAAPTNLEACHSLRKAVRRLRYALEWLGESTEPIKALQKILGRLNDASVALGLVERWEGRDAIAEYRAGLADDLEALRRQAVEAWMANALR